MKLRAVRPRVSNDKAEVFDVDGRQFVVIRPPPGAGPSALVDLQESIASLSDLLGMPVVCLSSEERLEVFECEEALARECDDLEREVKELRARLSEAGK